MVYNGKPYEQMDDLGVPPFLETPMWNNRHVSFNGGSEFLLFLLHVLWIGKRLDLPGISQVFEVALISDLTILGI